MSQTMKQTRTKKWQVGSILSTINRYGANLAIRYEGKPQKVVIGDGTTGALLVNGVSRGTALVWLDGYERAMVRHSTLSDTALEDVIFSFFNNCGNHAYIPSIRLARIAKGWDLRTAKAFVDKVKAQAIPITPVVPTVTEFLIDCANCGKHSVHTEIEPIKCDVCGSPQVDIERV